MQARAYAVLYLAGVAASATNIQGDENEGTRL
jgi:hypothetical protein